MYKINKNFSPKKVNKVNNIIQNQIINKSINIIKKI